MLNHDDVTSIVKSGNIYDFGLIYKSMVPLTEVTIVDVK